MSQQKVWFITGSSRGFGRVWTEAVLKRGDKVAASARNPKALKPFVEAYGDAVLPLKLDVTDRDAVFQAVRKAHQHFGRLDVILSNAGYGVLGAIEEVSIEDIRANFETNVFGTLSVIQAALPLLRAQGSGHILPVSSLAGLVAVPVAGIYEGSKFAVEGIAEALAAEVPSFGIRVTIIEPGPYATNFLSDSSIKQAVPNPVYHPARQQFAAMLPPDMIGNPAATVAAILKVVDAKEPPLRLILGSLLPMIRQVYADRVKTWEAWEDVSKAARGVAV